MGTFSGTEGKASKSSLSRPTEETVDMEMLDEGRWRGDGEGLSVSPFGEDWEGERWYE